MNGAEVLIPRNCAPVVVSTKPHISPSEFWSSCFGFIFSNRTRSPLVIASPLTFLPSSVSQTVPSSMKIWVLVIWRIPAVSRPDPRIQKKTNAPMARRERTTLRASRAGLAFSVFRGMNFADRALSILLTRALASARSQIVNLWNCGAGYQASGGWPMSWPLRPDKYRRI